MNTAVIFSYKMKAFIVAFEIKKNCHAHKTLLSNSEIHYAIIFESLFVLEDTTTSS